MELEQEIYALLPMCGIVPHYARVYVCESVLVAGVSALLLTHFATPRSNLTGNRTQLIWTGKATLKVHAERIYAKPHI